MERNELTCIDIDKKNCCPDGKCDDKNCPDTHTCCWQDSGSSQPKLGLCVKKGFCDSKKGLPKSNCRGDTVENFTYERNRLGKCSNCNCYNWRTICDIVIIIIIVILILITVGYVKKI